MGSVTTDVAPQKGRRGRPSLDHHTITNGILWIDKTGASWRDMPESDGSWKTVSSRFYRWCKAGFWDKLLAEVQKHAYARGEVEWSIHYVDSSVVRAHQHAAGAKRRSQKRKDWGVAKAVLAQRYT